MSRLHLEALRFKQRGPVDLVIEADQCFCVTGVSGSGKTLLLRAIVDLDVHEGQVFLDDIEAGQVKAPIWRKWVGMLPAESQWWYETVGEHFVSKRHFLEDLGFDRDVLKWDVMRLSTGERQRLALARLLENEPRALLLDEPSASLDRENVLRMEELIESYSREYEAPVLWVSHDPEQVERVATRQFQISGRSFIERGRPWT